MNSRLIDELGQAYATGSMTIASVAERLGVTVADAIVTLEEAGYARSIEHICLEESAREAILAGLRSDRMRRNGVPEVDLARVTRNVVASLRLSGIDARGWLNDTERA